MADWCIHQGDALTTLKALASESVQCCVTSPPYWGLRDYGVNGQIGLEKTPEDYVSKLVEIFHEVKRVLKSDSTLWLNLGDSYASLAGGYDTSGSRGTSATISPKTQAAVVCGKQRRPAAGLKPKDLVGIPWLTAFALRADGWYLRGDIIWSKKNPMPESVRDRPTRSHEYIFLLTKSARYYYDADAIAEPGSVESAGCMLRANKGYCPPGQTAHGGVAAPRPNRRDKQRGHGRRHAGFNDRWDAMERAEQCSGMRNKRSVWTVATRGFQEAHFATFPPDLIRPCILAGAKSGDTVLDPFCGSGTSGVVATELGCNFVGIELNPEYVKMAEKRIAKHNTQIKMFA